MAASFIDSVLEEMIAALVAAGVDKRRAVLDARARCTVIRQRWGGDKQYVPAPDKAELDRLIAEDVKRIGDRKEVARRHGVHLRTVSRAVTRHYKRKTRQSSGFGSDEWVL